MTAALDDLTKRTQKVLESTALGFEGDAASFVGAYLEGGQFASFTRTLKGGITYAFLGGGSSATDIDIVIRDMSGKPVAADVDDDANPVVEFTPPSDGRYQVTLMVAKDSPSSFVTMGVMRTQGLTIPASRIRESVYGAVEKAARLSAGIKERGMGDGLRFHAGGDFALYGTVMSAGEGIHYNGLKLTSKHLVFGSADSASQDINLALINAAGDSVVSDTDSDATPVLGFNAQPGGPFALKVDCVAASGMSLVTAVVLTVE